MDEEREAHRRRRRRDDNRRQDNPRSGRDIGGLGAARRYSPRGRSVREGLDRGADGGRSTDDRGRSAQRRGDRDPFRTAARLTDAEAAKIARRRTAAARARNRQKLADQQVPDPVARSAKARAAQRRYAGDGPGGRPPLREAPPIRPRTVVKRRLPKLGNPMRRLRLGTVIVIAMFLLIGGRLVQLQVTDAAVYAADALEQRLREEVVPAARGDILDRDGERLAYSVAANHIAVDPEMIEDPVAAAEALSPMLGIPASRLERLMEPEIRDDGTRVRHRYLARSVPLAVGEQIVAADIDPGIIVGIDERREVPGHDLAANVIGFTGTDGVGLAGLESAYEDVLRGVDGMRSYEVGHGGQPIPGGYAREEPADPGSSVRLSLDQDLQYQTQQILEGELDKKDAEFGAAVILDVQSGEIVAMASTPSYDAANPEEYDEELWRDNGTASVSDPGSVHKAIVVAAALEEGLIEPNDTLVVPPTINKGGVTYEDSYSHGEVPMTIAGILAHSSNVGTIMLADMLGPDRLYQYQQAFGLGQPTGVGLPGEAPGQLLPPDEWSGTSYGSIPIGHEITATPIQMAAVYATIANDGVYTQPNLVTETIDADGTVTEAAPPQTRQVLSPETAQAMQHLLQAPITTPDGTGVKAELPGYNVAGKTGTGRLVRDGQYTSGEVASFDGFAPADDPQYALAVFAYTPGGGGGSVAGPAFHDIMQATLGHFRVPPSGEPPAQYEVYG